MNGKEIRDKQVWGPDANILVVRSDDSDARDWMASSAVASSLLNFGIGHDEDTHKLHLQRSAWHGMDRPMSAKNLKNWARSESLCNANARLVQSLCGRPLRSRTLGSKKHSSDD